MNAFSRSVTKIFKDAMKSFETFPASMLCALGFALVTIVRIHLDWPQQEPYNFLFNCLHLSLGVGALFSLMSVTGAKTFFNDKKSFISSNIIDIIVSLITFLLLYYFGGINNQYNNVYKIVSGIWAARAAVVMGISVLFFIIIAGYPKDQSDFSLSLFMFHKAFFIAIIYGGAIIAGSSLIAGAIQGLLYKNMSSKVYMYISTIGGLTAFAIFLGYFPDFRKGSTDPHREVAQMQPKFIKVLFGTIMAPLMLALTLVLLIWTGKTFLQGMKSSFIQLSGIASSFAIGGIWLYMMLTHYEGGLAKFYKRIYPFAALIILAFEAWALYEQLISFGLKTTEYNFALIWIASVISVILIILKRDKSYESIIVIASLVAIIAVLPYIGYHSMPVRSQINRLEKILVSEGLLKDGTVIPATSEPERSVREAITDAVYYINYVENPSLPNWYDKDLLNVSKFKEKLGFEPIWPQYEQTPGGPTDIMSTSLFLPNGVMDIGKFDWVIRLSQYDFGQSNTMEIQGQRGLYTVIYNYEMKGQGLPKLDIKLDDKLILENDFKEFIDNIIEKYPLGDYRTNNKGLTHPNMEDLMLNIETPELEVKVVFSNIEINLNVKEDRINYYITIDSIYINERP